MLDEVRVQQTLPKFLSSGVHIMSASSALLSLFHFMSQLGLHIQSMVDTMVLKLPSLELSRKEDIKFLIGPALALRKSEVSPDSTNKTKATCKETRLALPVAFGGIQYVWRYSEADDTEYVVCISSQGNTL